MKCNIPAGDLQRKLADTYCRYQGFPVYVNGTNKNKLTLTRINDKGFGSGETFEIRSDDPDFDVSGIPLGYMNNNDTAYYLTRIPWRKSRQGLSQNSVRFSLVGQESLGKALVNAQNLFWSQGFIDMVLNNYPELEATMKMMRGKQAKGILVQQAVSRDIALRIDEQGLIFVYYKNDYVGWIKPNGHIVHVRESSLAWVISKYLSHILGWEID